MFVSSSPRCLHSRPGHRITTDESSRSTWPKEPSPGKSRATAAASVPPRRRLGRGPSQANALLLLVGTATLSTTSSIARAETDATKEQVSEAEEDSSSFESLDLEDLLSSSFLLPWGASVASIRSLSPKESPGIVTIVRGDEIRSWGARDLIDVLTMVPGFFFGVDVQGVVGVGIRGNWAHEGKILILLDGLEMNEINFQTFAFGHHIPVEAIDRIEIIRGPGSVIYGGNAELGVISIWTRPGNAIQGGRVSVRYGTPAEFYDDDGDDIGFLDVTAEAGMSHGEFTWSLSAFAGRSVRSEAFYQPLFGDGYQMADASEIRPLMLNGAFRWRTTEIRLLYDGYTYDSRDAFDEPTPSIQPYRFGGFYADLKSAIVLSPGLTFTPRFTYKRQRSWWTQFDSDELVEESLELGTYLRQVVTRVAGGANLSWDAFKGGNLIFGAEVQYDRGQRTGDDPATFDENSYRDDDGNNIPTLEFVNTIFFLQFLWLTDLVNLTVGGRLEAHSEFGAFAVPRVALTKYFDFGLHAKILASQAFRTPALQNEGVENVLVPDNEVERERTTVFEAELGYELLEGLEIVGNTYFLIIEDPIIYFFDVEAEDETYFNRDTLRTVGGEVQALYRGNRLSGEVGYSIYHVVDNIEDYEVPGRDVRLGAAQHKLTARISWEPFYGFFVTPTAAVIGDRYGFVDPTQEVPVSVDAQVLLGLGVQAQDLGGSGVDIGLFGHNLLDERDRFIQPYNGGHGLLPGRGRQVMLRLSYEYQR